MTDKMEVEQFITMNYMEFIMSVFRSKSVIPFNFVFASTEDTLDIHLLLTNYRFNRRKTLVGLLHRLLNEFDVFNEIDDVLPENRICRLRKWLFNDDDQSVKSIVEISPKMALLYYSTRFCSISPGKLIRSPRDNNLLKQICDNIYGEGTYKELDLMTLRCALFSEKNDKLLTYMTSESNEVDYDKIINQYSLKKFLVLHLLSLRCKVLWDLQSDKGSYEEGFRLMKECRYTYLKYIHNFDENEKDKRDPDEQIEEVELATLKYERIMKVDRSKSRKIQNQVDKMVKKPSLRT